MAAEDQGKTFKEMLLKNKEVKTRMTKAELEKVMDPSNYVGVAPQIVDSVVAKAEALVSPKKASRKTSRPRDFRPWTGRTNYHFPVHILSLGWAFLPRIPNADLTGKER